MIKKIISVSGKPGLYRLVNSGKNMLIVETIGTGKRMPIYARDKVVSLGDISIYTTEGDEPLANVLESVSAKPDGNPVDIKSFADDNALRAYFKEILPAFDDERVYTTDIKKLLSWYNLLITNGVTQFVEKKAPEAPAAKENAE
ncbi:MAG: DUF5606 domain-containing protein [Muribaculaceae bacterium]|nr:DUF5606 domain-containing protein [Muribaculaceae bacterium]